MRLLPHLSAAAALVALAAAPTFAAVVTASTNAEIRAATASSTDDDSGIRVFSGATSTLFFNVEGDGTGFQTFGVADFTVAAEPGATGLASASLDLTQSNAAFTADGNYAVYLARNSAAGVIDATMNPAGAPAYQVGNDGLAAIDPVFNVFPTPLGTDLFTQVANGTIETTTFDTSTPAAAYLLNTIQTGGTVRLVVVAVDTTTAATFAGQANNAGPAPTLSYTTTAVPEPASVALLGLGGVALLRRRR